MATNPLTAAHRAAATVDRELDVLFGRFIGTRDGHPRGRILAAYQQARRAMLQVYQAAGPRRVTGALEVLATLRQILLDVGRLALPVAEEIGRTSAIAQLEAYLAAGVTTTPAFAVPDPVALQGGWEDTVTARLHAVQALILADAEPYMIANDDGRLGGALQPGATQADAAYWLAYAAALGFSSWIIGRNGERAERIPFQRQAIPAVDNRTTPCCLDVASRGEIVGLTEPFYTPDPPAYSKKQMWTPFHSWCRTSVVLYLPEFDDGITEALQRNAGAELSRRDDGPRKDGG